MVRKTAFENGIRVISERLDHYRSMSLGIWVGVGSRDEMRSENGISHFIEHMIFKGTPLRDNLQIAKDLDAIGGLSNAFTSVESTCFHSRVLDKHLPTLAEILSDIFLHSLFESQDMEREREVILQEISMVEDTPDEQIHVLLNQLFWMDHPLGMPVLGIPSTVSSIEKGNILRYMQEFYTPERTLLVAAGNVDHDALTEFFRPLFESLPKKDGVPLRTAPLGGSGFSCHYKDLEQVHICMGGSAPHFSSEQRFASAVLNTILGGNMSSRLFQEIREKRGLAYSVYSFISTYMDAGMLGIYVGTDPRKVNEVLQLVQKEIKSLQAGDLSRSDLAAIKENLIGGIWLASESTDSRMMRLAKNEYIFGRYIPYEEVVERLEKVTVDEVIQVAKEAFQTGKVSLATLGPVKEEEIDLGCLTFHE